MLTGLQYLILRALMSGEHGAKDLQQIMADNDVKKSTPAFYQLMTRLVEKGYIESRWNEDAERRMRMYKITGAGSSAVDQTEAFYANRGGQHAFA